MVRALAVLIFALPFAAGAAPKLLALLPVDARQADLDAPTRVALEEGIRTAVGEALYPLGYTVLTGENTLEILRDNDVAEDAVCETSCALELARLLQAEYFLSAVVARTEGNFVAFVRLFESATGRQLGMVQLEAERVRDIRHAFAGQAPALFAWLEEAAPAAAAAATMPARPGRPADPPLAKPLPIMLRGGIGFRYGVLGVGSELRMFGPLSLNTAIGIGGISGGLSLGPAGSEGGLYVETYHLVGFFPGITLTGLNAGYDLHLKMYSLRFGAGMAYIYDLGAPLPFLDLSVGAGVGRSLVHSR